MSPETKAKLKRRLDHLSGVLSDNMGENENEPELFALYDVVRDIQPCLCQAISEEHDEPEWALRYKEPILSDEVQIRYGTFLWPEELPQAGD